MRQFLSPKILAAFLLAVFLFAAPGLGEDAGNLRNGDILFQEFPSPQSIAIKIATNSEYTHCGIFFYDDSGKGFVWEAVQPVRITPLDSWIGRSQDSFYVAKRIDGSDSLLTDSVLLAMKSYTTEQLGKDYDPYFNWGDDRLYCSELVWKAYFSCLGIRLCEPRPIKDYNLANPLVQAKLKERYGDNIPYDEPAVSPQDLFDSPLLHEIK